MISGIPLGNPTEKQGPQKEILVREQFGVVLSMDERGGLSVLKRCVPKASVLKRGVLRRVF